MKTFVVATATLLLFVTSAKAYSTPRCSSRRDLFATVSSVGFAFGIAEPTANAQEDLPAGYRPIPRQFIAALGDPNSSHGDGTDSWGIWTVDPGPRGVFLQNFDVLRRDGAGPYGWKFDEDDWWLEEHGIIMERPDFPLPAGRYVVTGGRDVSSVLTVGSDGRWSLADGTQLRDVTHLPCRTARYTRRKGGGACSPIKARRGSFPVRPGAEMPSVNGCLKQDYAVLFIVGVQAQ